MSAAELEVAIEASRIGGEIVREIHEYVMIVIPGHGDDTNARFPQTPHAGLNGGWF